MCYESFKVGQFSAMIVNLYYVTAIKIFTINILLIMFLNCIHQKANLIFLSYPELKIMSKVKQDN